MAAEIKSVSNHVKGTTAAVVTMQGAVIAAEMKSAEKVCNNVNRGFFTMMRSQISQKIASKHSRVEALLMQLGQQRRQLAGIKTNMEREYGRIAARYLRIFTNINKELEIRISQIDQPIFDFVNKHMTASTNRMHSLTSWCATSQSEGISQSQRILASKMKHHAQIALEQSKDFLAQIGEQRVLTNKILISNPIGNEDKLCQVPVAICETISDSAGIARTEISTPDNIASNNASQIYNTIRSTKDLPWKEADKNEQITDEFCRCLEASNASSRVKDKIKAMYLSANFETL
jgi:hypothetical protein